MTKTIISFLAVCILSACLGWIAGYNFDSRGGGVAIWILFTLLCACIVAVESKELK